MASMVDDRSRSGWVEVGVRCGPLQRLMVEVERERQEKESGSDSPPNYYLHQHPHPSLLYITVWAHRSFKQHEHNRTSFTCTATLTKDPT